MFKYVGDISKIAQNIISTYIGSGKVAVDGTLGNGFDCDFLSDSFERVYAFDIQKVAIENYSSKNKENVILVHDSHENLLNYINEEEIDVAMFNLGFLPGGDKLITTKVESTISSLKETLKLLKSGGIVTIAVYVGHPQGIEESEAILSLMSQLPKDKYGVLIHKFINRNSNSPYLLVVEKK